MTERIFVSYDHQDRGVLRNLEKVLREHGIVGAEDIEIVDPQKELRSGDNIREAIKHQINSANKVVIIASKNSEDSQWVNYEAGMASALEKPIFVISPRGCGKKTFLSALGDVECIEAGNGPR